MAPNELPPSARAVRSDAPVVERGVGLFETILLSGARASRFDAHLARLRATCERLGLPAPDAQLAVAAARRAIAERAATRGGEVTGEAALRLTWLAAGLDLDEVAAWRLDASARAIPPATLRRRAGCHAITLPAELQRDTPEAKSTSYLAAVLGLRRALRDGADEAFFVTGDGMYLEGTATALVAWDDGRLAAPARGMLPSVTADAFTLGQGRRRPLARGDLLAGAVVLGSLTLAAPLVSLDGMPCAQPAAMLARIAAFNQRLVAEAAPL
jgi:branched-subunit amino acid aminotransferase/4-amino-4-deoxychorismate lyase